VVNGFWASTEEIAQMAVDYELCVTVREPRERATAWHATDLCRHCGSCVLRGTRGPLCPGKLGPHQIRSSPQGYGPARNLIAFTGGDLACRAEFYAQATKRIKRACRDKMWVLLETNGYGLTPRNLDTLASAGLDSFWLDIKAYKGETYRKLCGTRNEHILEAPARILDRGFVLEVLSLYIPGWVETDQLVRIAELLREVDARIPFTILAFFPEYKLGKNRPPTLTEMLRAYSAVREIGLKRVKLGNCGVFAKEEEEWRLLLAAVGREGLG
jgi:pyruvate-formate lyase-activating enzyme